MRKSKLLSDNKILAKRLAEADSIISSLKNEIDRKNSEIEFLKVQLSEASSVTEEITPDNTESVEEELIYPDEDISENISETAAAEETESVVNSESEEETEEEPKEEPVPSAYIKDEASDVHGIFNKNLPQYANTLDYASKVIGKTVLEATKVNCILASQNSETGRELINLVLGKTEVCKAEILEIVSSDEADEIKREKIDKKYSDCLDYLQSILNQ